MVEWVERLMAHAKMTAERYGLALPIVDYEPGVDRKAFDALDCDDNLLAKWLVERHPDLEPHEVIVESVVGSHVTVLYAGTPRTSPCWYREHRTIVEVRIEEDLTWYVDRPTFQKVATQQVCDECEDDRIEEIRTPRWVNRGVR